MSNVTHPSHYNAGKIEVIEAIEDWGLGFHRGNAVKYTARAGKKDPGKEIEDLEKATWYLKREIERLKAKAENREPVRPNDMNPKSSAASSFAIDALNSVKRESPPGTVDGVPHKILSGEWVRVLESDIGLIVWRPLAAPIGLLDSFIGVEERGLFVTPGVL